MGIFLEAAETTVVIKEVKTTTMNLLARPLDLGNLWPVSLFLSSANPGRFAIHAVAPVPH